MHIIKLIGGIVVIVLLVFVGWEIKYHYVLDASETFLPKVSGYQVVQSKIESTAMQNAAAKAEQARNAYLAGDRSKGDALTNEAFAELDHGACIANRNCNGSTLSQTPAPILKPTPPSVTTSGVSLITPAPSVSPTGANKWEVTLPANLEYHTGIRVSAGQFVGFSDWVGSVKLDPRETYVNPPTGVISVDQVKLTFPEPWVNPQGWTGALLARIGGKNYADVSGRVTSSFQAEEDGEIILSINCLAGERHNATGSFHGAIEVQ